MQKLQSEAVLQKDHAAELCKTLGETREWVEQLHEELDVSQVAMLPLPLPSTIPLTPGPYP